jgi:hypothetical protein
MGPCVATCSACKVHACTNNMQRMQFRVLKEAGMLQNAHPHMHNCDAPQALEFIHDRGHVHGDLKPGECARTHAMRGACTCDCV